MPSITLPPLPQNMVRHIRLATFSNVTGQASAEPLVPLASPNPDVAVATVSPTDPTIIDIMPGTLAGNVTLVVNKVPQCPDPLIINLSVIAPANIGRVEYVEVSGPDTPKP